MGENSAIEWCDHTFNAWLGCTKISPACDHCYAESWARRTGSPELWQGERRRTSAENWLQPVRWNRVAEAAGRPAKVFCSSLADVFDNQVPAEWRVDLWRLIRATPWLTWLLLTKRPQNIVKMLPEDWPAFGNVWLGTTVENQAEAERRIPHLLSVPARVRFLSCEPLLGPVDLTRVCLLPQKPGSARAGIHLDALRGQYVESGMPYIGEWDITGPFPADAAPLRIHWVIAGGESGPGRRAPHPDWFRSLRDQCVEARVPFFFKQWGDWAPAPAGPDGIGQMIAAGDVIVAEDGRRAVVAPDLSVGELEGQGVAMRRVRKWRAGAELDGREWREMPADA